MEDSHVVLLTMNLWYVDMRAEREENMKYEVNVNKLERINENSNLRGFASVVFNNCFKVGNIAIMENREGKMFVSMPRYETTKGDEDYKDICNPITKEFRKELYDVILTSFEELEPGNHTKVNVEHGDQSEQLEINVNVTPFEREGSNIRGIGRIYIENQFVVSNVVVLAGKKGFFVAMPSYKTKQVDGNGKSVYQDIAYPVTKVFRDRLFGEVLNAYENALTEQKTKAAPVQRQQKTSKTGKEKLAVTEGLPFR